MRVEPFVTSYRDEEHIRVYFFPGMDDNGHVLARMMFITPLSDYRYTRLNDGSIEYILNENPSEIKCRIQNISTGETKDTILKT
jgi:hypothetical protein